MKLADAFTEIDRLCIDTSPFIYFVERYPAYIERIRAIFQRLDEGAFEGVTSSN